MNKTGPRDKDSAQKNKTKFILKEKNQNVAIWQYYQMSKSQRLQINTIIRFLIHLVSTETYLLKMPIVNFTQLFSYIY